MLEFALIKHYGINKRLISPDISDLCLILVAKTKKSVCEFPTVTEQILNDFIIFID